MNTPKSWPKKRWKVKELLDQATELFFPAKEVDKKDNVIKGTKEVINSIVESNLDDLWEEWKRVVLNSPYIDIDRLNAILCLKEGQIDAIWWENLASEFMTYDKLNAISGNLNIKETIALGWKNLWKREMTDAKITYCWNGRLWEKKIIEIWWEKLAIMSVWKIVTLWTWWLTLEQIKAIWWDYIASEYMTVDKLDAVISNLDENQIKFITWEYLSRDYVTVDMIIAFWLVSAIKMENMDINKLKELVENNNMKNKESKKRKTS